VLPPDSVNNGFNELGRETERSILVRASRQRGIL
jgi:hypothetical protein